MITAMKANHPNMNVTDLASATKTKTSKQLDQMFVDSASYILRYTVGATGKAKSKKTPTRTATKGTKPLWNTKQLKVDDHFSCISYLNVTNVDGSQITVKNHLGGSWLISKDLLVRDAWSADHYDQEVKCSMTELSELMDTCYDTIFKVSFKKKVDVHDLDKKLKESKLTDLKKLSTHILDGESVEITGHLVNSDNKLGRSLVIDLNAPKNNNFR
jgi:hypothetical protein